MDISKQPIKTDLGLSPKIELSPSQKNIISDIRELKLEIGKVYSATVIQVKNSAPSNTEQTLKLFNEQTPVDSKAKAMASNEWLILVKGKTVLISSEKHLESGQKLLLKLEPSTSGEKSTLIAQLQTAKTTVPTQVTTQPLLQTTSASQVSQSQQPSPNMQLDSANIKVLLQALNLTLDKQLPLQQSFQQLTTILNQATTTSISADQIKIVDAIRATLIDKLPKLNEISNLNNHAKTSPNGAVKQSMLDSGLFLEKSLLTQPEKLIAFKERLSSLETLLPPNRLSPNQLPQKLDGNNTAPSNTTNTANMTSLTPPTSLPQNYGSAIQKIQQTIDHLLQLATHNKTSPSPKMTETTPSVQSDLKANLLSTSSLLTKHLAAELSDAQLKSIFLGGTSEQYAASPFAFPILPSASTSASSKALFDKQEFSTGQILKLLAGMIHKLQFNQLHSLLHSNTNSDNSLQQTWFFELPVLNTNQSIQTFNFRIDKEPQDSKDEESTDEEQRFQWKLLLSFDLDMLGPIYVLVKLSQNSISSELWADKDSTYSLLQKESAHFKEQLEKIGLNVNEVLCKKGQPNQIKTKLDRHLVDTKV